jgi:hypothetical protein
MTNLQIGGQNEVKHDATFHMLFSIRYTPTFIFGSTQVV